MVGRKSRNFHFFEFGRTIRGMSGGKGGCLEEGLRT